MKKKHKDKIVIILLPLCCLYDFCFSFTNLKALSFKEYPGCPFSYNENVLRAVKLQNEN